MTRGEDGSGSGSYTVGYKKPPKHSRFQKGQSGNKKGRPKGTKNLKTETIEELSEMVKVRLGDRQVRVSKHRALLKVLTLKAMKGDVRSLKTLLDFYVQIFGLEGRPVEAEIRMTAEEHAALDLFEKRFKEAINAKELQVDGGEEGNDHDRGV